MVASALLSVALEGSSYSEAFPTPHIFLPHLSTTNEGTKSTTCAFLSQISVTKILLAVGQTDIFSNCYLVLLLVAVEICPGT